MKAREVLYLLSFLGDGKTRKENLKELAMYQRENGKEKTKIMVDNKINDFVLDGDF
jgi:hypothetical protein